MKIEDIEKEISLGVDNIVLRGSTIRNTDRIYGLVLYCGHDSKVMMNSA